MAQLTPEEEMIKAIIGGAQLIKEAKDAQMSNVAKSATPAPEEMPPEQLQQEPLKPSEMYAQKSLAGPSPQAKVLMDAILKEQEGTIRNQENAIGKQEALAQLMMGREPKTNLNPILNLVDQWTGSKLTEGYKPPQSSQDMATQAFTLQDKISHLRGELTKTQQGFLRDRLKEILDSGGFDQNKFYAMQSKEASEKRRGDQYNESQQKRYEDEIGNKLTKEVTTPMLETKRDLDVIDKNLASGEWQQIGIALSRLSRSVAGEKGVLTDNDIGRIMPPNYQGSVAKFLSYISATPSAQLPEPFVAKLREAAKIAKEASYREYKSKLDLRRKAYTHPNSVYRKVAAGPGSVYFDSADTEINSVLGNGQVAPTTPGAPGGVLSPAQWKAQKDAGLANAAK